MTGPETLPGVRTEAPVQESRPGWDALIRGAGISIALLATVVTAFLELELTTLRTGSFGAVLNGDSPYEGTGAALPLAVPLAIGANLAIAWFAVSTTGRRWAVGPPWALWTLLMFAASGLRTAEGDYLVGATNWVALVTILAGSLAFAVHAYRMILKPLDKPAATGSELSGGV